MKPFPLILFLAIVCAAQLGNQSGKSKGYVTTDVIPTLTLRAGESGSAELRFRVNPGYHVNSHNPGNPLLIPQSWTFNLSIRSRWERSAIPKVNHWRWSF